MNYNWAKSELQLRYFHSQRQVHSTPFIILARLGSMMVGRKKKNLWHSQFSIMNCGNLCIYSIFPIWSWISWKQRFDKILLISLSSNGTYRVNIVTFLFKNKQVVIVISIMAIIKWWFRLYNRLPCVTCCSSRFKLMNSFNLLKNHVRYSYYGHCTGRQILARLTQ